MIVLQFGQYLALLIGGLVRYCLFLDIGRYNRNISWPKSYKLKLCLQFLMIVCVLCELGILLVIHQFHFILRELSLLGQLLVWSASVSLHYFEYYRALGHVWYVHPLFWWYSTFYYSCCLFLHWQD